MIHENNTSRGVAPDQDSAILALEKGENHFLMKIVNGGGGSGFYFRLVGDALPDSVRELLKLELASWSEEQFGEVSNYYQSTLWSEGLERAARITELEKEDAELLKTVPTSMIMGDLAEGRETFVLMRAIMLLRSRTKSFIPVCLPSCHRCPMGLPPIVWVWLSG